MITENDDGNYREWSIQHPISKKYLFFRFRRFRNLGYEFEYRFANQGWRGNIYPHLFFSRDEYMHAIKDTSFRFMKGNLK